MFLAAILGPAFVLSAPSAVRSEEGGAVNYIHVETQRVIKLQEENKFLLQRLKDTKEKVEGLQAELLSVRNAYMEREDIIPRTQQELSERYEEKIGVLEQEIRRLKGDLASQEKDYQALDARRSMAQDELNSAAQTKSDLQQTLEVLRRELAQAQERVAGLEKKEAQRSQELSQQQKERQDLQERLSLREKESGEQIKALNERIEQLNKEKEILAGSSASSLKASEQERDKTVKEFQKKIDELTLAHAKEIAVLAKDKENLQARLAQAQEHTNGIEGNKERLAGEIQELKVRLEQSQARSSGLEATLKTKEEEIVKLQTAGQSAAASASAAAQDHARALEQLKKDLAAKEAQLVSLGSQEQANLEGLTRKVDELEGKLSFANQKAKEMQEKAESMGRSHAALAEEMKVATERIAQLNAEKDALAMAKDEQQITLARVKAFEEGLEQLRSKLQESELELGSARRENDLLLAQLVASKDEQIRLNDEINQLNENAVDQEKLTQLTRELLASENTVYEKELIIEGLRSDQKKLERALGLAEESIVLLKAELDSLKVSEVSYHESGALDLELNELEERVQRQIRGQ